MGLTGFGGIAVGSVCEPFSALVVGDEGSSTSRRLGGDDTLVEVGWNFSTGDSVDGPVRF